MNIFDTIISTLTDMNIISAITSTVFIILLGFFCRKKGIFDASVGKTLSKVVLSVSLPFLAFNSFMSDIDSEKLQKGLSVLIWGVLIYIILIFISGFFFSRSKFNASEKTTLKVLTTFGSTTFFGTPIVSALYGPLGVIYSNLFNIGYRIFLYSYGYIKMSGLKFEKKNIKIMFLNPIVIATFLGLFIWIFQDFLPQVMIAKTDLVPAHQVAFIRIDQTAPWLFKPMTFLASLASPLAWLAIGATLGEISFKDAAKNGVSWYYSFIKVLVVPLINLAIVFLISLTGLLKFDFTAMAAMTIMMAAPTATVAAAYSISFDKDSVLSSNASLVSTILAVIMIPFWIVVLSIISNMGLI